MTRAQKQAYQWLIEAVASDSGHPPPQRERDMLAAALEKCDDHLVGVHLTEKGCNSFVMGEENDEGDCLPPPLLVQTFPEVDKVLNLMLGTD